MKKILVLILAIVLVCMMFLTGCTEKPKEKPVASDRIALTSEDLAYFNGDSFFNGEYMNIRNQFLSSIYEKPADIDLYQLFYCGSGISEVVSEDELKVVAEKYGIEGGAEMLPCPCEKISRSNMNKILVEYLDTPLADTNKVGLENFIYLPEYDAYYFLHGDTNYRTNVEFTGGERDGNEIRLFYDDDFYGDGGKVLILKKAFGTYQFVSNQLFDSDKGPVEATETKTDSGKFLGQADNNFVEIQISGVPDTEDPTVFMLSDNIKNSLESLDLEIDGNIKFEYYVNENDQKVITKIEKI